MADRTVAFDPRFVKLTGGITSALLLSQALYWSKRVQADGWFYKTQEEWEEETGLTRSEQETARKRLLGVTSPSGAQIWEEWRRGVPAKLFYRLNAEALNECLQSSVLDSINPVCGNPAIKNAEILQSGVQESSTLDRANGAHLLAEIPQSFVSEITTEITTEITPETTTAGGEYLDPVIAAQPSPSATVAAPPPVAHPIDLDLPKPPTEAEMAQRLETTVSVTQVHYKPSSYAKSLYMKGARLKGGYIAPGAGVNAIQVYHERNSADNPKLQLTDPQQDDLVKAITDLDRWRIAVIAWSQAGHNPRNLTGQIEWYAKGPPAGRADTDRREFGILSKPKDSDYEQAADSSSTVTPEQAAYFREQFKIIANERAADARRLRPS